MTTMTDFAPTLESRASWWLAPLAALRDTWNRYHVYERTYSELNALTNRELSDLGISRASIAHLAFEAAYGETA